MTPELDVYIAEDLADVCGACRLDLSTLPSLGSTLWFQIPDESLRTPGMGLIVFPASLS